MILAINTAYSELCIAVATDDGLVLNDVRVEPSDKNVRAIHDEKLAAETERLLRSEEISASDIDKIGVIIGPGGFTGLRIGLSFAKGLAFGTGAGIVPIVLHDVMCIMNGAAEGLLITPGYRPDLFYVSDNRTPRDIRIVTGIELMELPYEKQYVHSSFGMGNHPFFLEPAMRIYPSIAVIAQMTADAKPLLGTDIDGLEPLYLTEFTVRK